MDAENVVLAILHGDGLRNSQEFANGSQGSNPSAARRFAEFAEFAGGEDSQRWTVANREAVARWLVYIGETNPDITREVLDRCRDNPKARAYFVRRAVAELPPLSVDHEATTVRVETPGAAVHMAAPSNHVSAFLCEARRRGMNAHVADNPARGQP